MVNQFQVAKEQKKRAGELQQEAKNVKKREIRPEFMTALNEAELLSLKPMANYEAAKANIDANSANALRSIREASPYGGVTADAISAVLGNQNKELVNLDATQGEFKLRNRQNAIQELKGVGAEQERLTQEQLDEKRKIMASAEALLQSSTANKQNALETVGSTVAGLGTALGKGISAASDINALKEKGLVGKDFQNQKRNILFGSNATGGASGGLSQTATGGKTVTQDEFINLATKLVSEGKAKTISEAYNLLWDDGYKY
jgi:hypothetical protein